MNIKKIFVGFGASAIMLGSMAVPTFAAQPTNKGFDQYGYNNTARNFVGTGASWSLAKGLPADYLGKYANDKLVMKWNAEWDRGNAENWANTPYNAYIDNEWNGSIPGGSGDSEHFKAKWVGSCGEDYTPLPSGGYCIWGQFEAIFDRGMVDGVQTWWAHAIPAGYGAK